jgi:exopolysaccharide biosynthesis polyprenyl glycosylphosphotransferase
MRTNLKVMDGADAEDPTTASAGAIASPVLQEQLAIETARGAERASLLRRLMLMSDLVAALVAGILGALAGGMGAVQVLGFAAVVAVAWLVLVFMGGLYTVDTLGAWASGIPEIGRLAALAIFVSWPLVATGQALGAGSPMAAALVAAPLTLGLALAGRTTLRGALHRAQPLRQRTLIIGSGQVASQLLDRLRRHGEFGLDPIGVVDDDVHGDFDLDVPVLGHFSELREVLRRHHVERVMVAFSRADHEELLECLRACREERVAVDIVPRLFEFLDGARSIEQIGGIPLLTMSAPRLSRVSRAAKRVLDVAVAGSLLLAMAPVLGLIALAIKIQSRGPVLFRQPRAGLRGTPFMVYKLRSMYVDAEARKADLMRHNEMQGGVLFKVQRDPRITPLGRWLRRLSIDEMPQLINVLKGEMSLVGPRPLVLPESALLGDSWHARRLDLRPGLTGPWQISGRSDLTVQDMVRLDYQYVTGWSLTRDLEILLATITVVLNGRGAY